MKLDSKHSHSKKAVDGPDEGDAALEDWVKRRNDFFIPLKKKHGSLEELDPKTLKIENIFNLPIDIKPVAPLNKEGKPTPEALEHESWNPK